MISARETIQGLEYLLEGNSQAIADLEVQNKELRDDTGTLKGIVYRHSIKLDKLNENVVNFTTRSMQKNITISGLASDTKEEKCKDTVLQFLRDVMKILVQPNEIYVAHRAGKPGRG